MTRKSTARITVSEVCEKCGASFMMEAPQVAAVRLMVVWRASHYCDRQWWDAGPEERKTLTQPGPGKKYQNYSRKYFGGKKQKKGEAKDGTKTRKRGREISLGHFDRAGD